MSLSHSIFSLANSNNGFFKSERQANFLISQMSVNDGLIGHANSGYNACPIFAEWDNKGITKIVKASKNGDIIMFERKCGGSLTALELKLIKKLEQDIKYLEKEIIDNESSFKDGSYNGSGNINTYTSDMINRYNHCQMHNKERLQGMRQELINLKMS